MLAIARDKAGPALREMTFHQRAIGVKALATLLNENKDALTELSFHTGATKADSFIDIDGGIGTMFVFASKAKRELPDDHILMDGDTEALSRHGTFMGQHMYTSKRVWQYRLTPLIFRFGACLKISRRHCLPVYLPL